MRNKDIRITHARVTPIAFRDGPLLNASGIHEPWALRSIIAVSYTHLTLPTILRV